MLLHSFDGDVLDEAGNCTDIPDTPSHYLGKIRFLIQVRGMNLSQRHIFELESSCPDLSLTIYLLQKLPPPIALMRVSEQIFERYDCEELSRTCVTKLSDISCKTFLAEIEVHGLGEEGSASSAKEDLAPRLVAAFGPSPKDGGGRSHDACYLCMDNAADAVLVECGHGGLCASCADLLWRRGVNVVGGRSCPLCRRPFIGVLHILSETDSTVWYFFT